MGNEGEPDISLRTVLTAVNQQSKDIEAIIDAKVTEKTGGLREELQGANQLMKSQVKKLKTDASYKWKYGSAITDLLARGLIVETLDIPFVVNPLTVSVQSNNKKWLILDLREINRHLWKQSVKFEDMRFAKHYINANSYMFKYDVHSAYHHVDIFPPHTKYLGFAWEFNGVKKYFKFLVLPFGLSTACYIFTKITRPLIKKWRGEGEHIIMYLDDGLGVHDDKELCTQMAIQVKNSTNIDTDKGVFTIPDNRIDKIMSTISDIDFCLTKNGKVILRKVASLIGQIISTSPVIGNIVYLMTKHLSIDINSVHSWNSYIHLSVDSIHQINFWRFNLHEANVKPFKTDVSWQTILYSDARNMGYGGYIVENPYNIAHGTWLESEVSTSSTWKELTAVKNVFLSLINFLSGKNVKWFTDNPNVVSIVSKGSKH
ncbi:unnamed protein product [Mytilus coruscus]|uniref:Reverse transcriptase domain-containing protein n=1 Tax=Mytilus coruscus TaxID=42192 RepID=A0A6J8EJY1_MYTCO|nr:unnamed protein product [Mytilus coruscus]